MSVATPVPARQQAVSLETSFKALYDQLSQMAHNKLYYERVNHTMDTTALVHEAYYNLSRQREKVYVNSAQFLAVAAIAMRRILVNYARQHKRLKRGADNIMLTYGNLTLPVNTTPEEILALHEALKRLRFICQRKSRIVEYHFFGGFNHQEIAESMGVSIDTVRRDWRLARAWLSREMKSTLQ